MKYYDKIADSGLPNTSDTIAGSEQYSHRQANDSIVKFIVKSTKIH